MLLANLERLGAQGALPPGVAAGFGGGIGRAGLVCGAISGAVIAAGWRHGTGSDAPDKDKLYDIARLVLREFQSKFGSTQCRTLTGFDLSDPESYEEAKESGVFTETCPEFVEFCASKLAEMLPL